MRRAVGFIVLTLLGCAALASHQRKPFPLLIDGAADNRPGAWPRYAEAPIMPGVMICKPMLIPRHDTPKPIVRT